MESITALALKQLLALGGGYVTAAIMFLLYLREHKDKKEQAEKHAQQLEKFTDSKDKLYEKLFVASDKQTEIMTRVNTVLEHNDATLDSVNGILNTLMNRRFQ